jgi:hypothetical protein
MDPLWWIVLGLGLIAIGAVIGYLASYRFSDEVPLLAVIIGGSFGTMLGFIGLVGLVGLVLFPLGTLVLGGGIGFAARKQRRRSRTGGANL